jgi:hypothetical protein
MKKMTRITLASAAFTAFFVALSAMPASALTVSPPIFREDGLNPGDTAIDVLKIENESPETLTVYPLVKNFTADAKEGGEPQFYEADENPDGTALAKWITIDTSPITLEPKQKANLPFTINVPKDGAQPGGHYGAILLSTTPPEEGGKIGIASQLGVLVLVSVTGDLREAGTIAEFGFAEKKLWYESLPVDFFLRFENDGNTHLTPVGNVFVTDWTGRQVAVLKVNETARNVLPRSIRKFDFGWQRGPVPEGEGFFADMKREWANFAIGKYKALLVVNYGKSNQVLSGEREFTVWPWRLMTVFGAAALVVVALFVLLVRAYNKAVIRKYEIQKGKKGT